MANHIIEFDYTFDEYDIGEEITVNVKVDYYRSTNFDPTDTDQITLLGIFEKDQDILNELKLLTKCGINLIEQHYKHLLNEVIPQYFFDDYLMKYGHEVTSNKNDFDCE